MIITCRRKEDGGKWQRHRRSPAAAACARRSPRASTTSTWKKTSPRRFRRFGKTKRIISYHNFRKTPDDLRELHARMAQLDPDIVKIATMANDPHDNVRMLEMMQESEMPTVGMCMGDIGTPSRILAGKFGAPFTYATFHHERTLAPGQLSFKQMTEIYRYEQIGPDTAVYGVIADPVGHSLSPHVHNAAFEAQGHQRGLRAVPRAGRRARPVHGGCPAAGHQGPERHDSAQGSDRQASHEGRPRGEEHRRGEHGGVRRRAR